MTRTVVTDAAGVPLYITDTAPGGGQAPGSSVINAPVTVNGTMDVSGAAVVGGSVTATGGIVGTCKSYISTIPIGSVAYGSLGTDGVTVANTVYVADIFIPVNATFTGIGMLQGGVSATDKWIYALFSSAGGNPVITTALGGVVADGATDAFLEIPFTATYHAIGPARYWIGVQCNGTTTKNRKVAASTYLLLCKSYTSTGFGTIPSLTVPTSFAATTAPIAYIY